MLRVVADTVLFVTALLLRDPPCGQLHDRPIRALHQLVGSQIHSFFLLRFFVRTFEQALLE